MEFLRFIFSDFWVWLRFFIAMDMAAYWVVWIVKT